MRTAIIFHLWYEDLLDEFLCRFSKVGDFSLFVSMPKDMDNGKSKDRIRSVFPSATFIECDNLSADIYPFLCVLHYIKTKNLHFDKYVKVHTKKSLRVNYGDDWRKSLCNAIFDDFEIKSYMRGIVSSSKYTTKLFGNERDVEIYGYIKWLSERLDYDILTKVGERYTIGTMFMADGDIIEDLSERIARNPFPINVFEDHRIAEAFERLLQILPLFYGRKINFF